MAAGDLEEERPQHRPPPSLDDDTPGAIPWEADASGVAFSFVGRSSVAVLGIPPERWISEPGMLRHLVPPEDWGALLDTLYRAAVSGEVETCGHRAIHADGSVRWMQTAVRRRRAGAPPTLVGLTVDVSALRRGDVRPDEAPSAELDRGSADVRQRVERLQLLVDSQDDGLFEVRADGSISSWNRGAHRVLGYRTPEVAGLRFVDLFPADTEPGTVDRLLAEAERLGRAQYEGWLVRRSAERFWGLVSLAALEGEDQLYGFGVLARDLTEQRRTEQSLRDREEHLRLLVSSMQDYGVFFLSTEGIVQSWNTGAQRLKGYRADEAIGSPLEQYFPPETPDAPRRLLEEAALKGSATYEGWLVRKGGSRFWGIVTLSAMEDEQGRLRGFSNVARDLSERKRTEDAIREREELLRLLIDSLEDTGVFMMTPEGRVASWSPGAERIKGYREGEILGAPVSVFFPSDVQAERLGRLLAQAATAGRADYEGWIVRKGGDLLWVNITFSAVRDAQGNLRGFSNVARDLTERMRAERSQALLADVSNLLARSLDPKTTVEHVAELATRKLARACVVGMLVDGVVQPVAVAHVDPEVQALLARAVRPIPLSPRVEHGLARVLQTEHAEWRDVVSDPAWIASAIGVDDMDAMRQIGARSYICAPLSARGKTFGAIALLAPAGNHYTRDDVGIAEELARRAAIAIDNARLYEEAQAAIRVREDVLAIVSHDLRNPLGTIVLGARQLLTSDDPRSAAGTAERILRSAQRMNLLILDLLDYTQVQSGRFVVRTDQHEARDLVREAIDLFEPSAADKRITLREDTAELGPVAVICDRDRILQVLSNLIGNALKFTGEGGTVTVAARRDRGVVVFTVTDSGRGIAAADLPHIFDPYYQVSAGHREGLGLGLAIAKAIVESHGHRLTVESALGQGTRFTFRLAVAGESVRAA